MKKRLRKSGKWSDDGSCKKKFYLFYIVVCILLPLIITDSLIVFIVVRSERKLQYKEMENTANAVKYYIFDSVDHTAGFAKQIYTNRYVYEFLEKQYGSTYDYVTGYYDFFKGMGLGGTGGSNYARVVLYSGNETLVDGGKVSVVSGVSDSSWYREFKGSGRQQMLLFHYEESQNYTVESRRKMMFLSRMNFYNRNSENFLLIEFDYAAVIRYLKEMNHTTDIFLCREGGDIVLSSGKYANMGTPFEKFKDYGGIGYHEKIMLYGTELDIYVMDSGNLVLKEIMKHLPLILFLILVNAALPIIIYRDKVREQEIIVERQSAELLALRSQINPHFLFNALESIRMHSVLKKEKETADMIEKLSVLQRQYVDWGDDFVKMDVEMEFVKAYLGIQKYRFGGRLSYEIQMDEECGMFQIPKLTLVTFVENACVHGIESKSVSGWIFVRVYRRDGEMCIEIEDTGRGMEKEEMDRLLWKMRHASIGILKEKGRVGILNACLRLKLYTDEKVQFELDGEEGLGLMVQIRVPCRYCIQKKEEIKC